MISWKFSVGASAFIRLFPLRRIWCFALGPGHSWIAAPLPCREKTGLFHRGNGGNWGEGWWLKISWIMDSSLKYMVSSDGIKSLDTSRCLDWLPRILRKDTCHCTCIGPSLRGGQVCSKGLQYRTDVFFTTFVHRSAMVFSLRSALISSLAGLASGDCFLRLPEPLKERVDIMISCFSFKCESRWFGYDFASTRDMRHQYGKEESDIYLGILRGLPYPKMIWDGQSHGFSHWTMELMDSLGTRKVPGCTCSSSSAAKHHTVDRWNPATPVMCKVLNHWRTSSPQLVIFMCYCH